MKHLLDLTNTRIRRILKFTLEDLMAEDWKAIQYGGEESWTQAIGRGAYLADFEGLIAPSARDRSCRNVVIFPEKLKPESEVEILKKSELPPHPSKWAT